MCAALHSDTCIYLPSGQLQAALERRRSIGRERNLAVDEQVAKGQKRSEPQKSRAEMVADFVRRSFKKSKARGREEEKDEEEVVKNENVPEGAAVKQQAEAKVCMSACVSIPISTMQN